MSQQNADVAMSYANGLFGGKSIFTPDGWDISAITTEATKLLAEAAKGIADFTGDKLAYANTYDVRAQEAIRQGEDAIARSINPSAETVAAYRRAAEIDASRYRQIGDNLRSQVSGSGIGASLSNQTGTLSAIVKTAAHLGSALAIGQIGYKAYQASQTDSEAAMHEAVHGVMATAMGAVVGMGVGGLVLGLAIPAGIVSGLAYGAFALGLGFVTGRIAEDQYKQHCQALTDYLEEVGAFWSNAYTLLTSPNDEVRDYFLKARGGRWVYVDPLALDLDGDGIETRDARGADTVVFDHDADGVKHGTGWVDADDGMLVLDRNGNGTIDSGRELFGDQTLLANGQRASDGFAALRELDGNADGVFDANDMAYGQVRVWRDLNQDGISQVDELKTLADTGIAAINLNATASNTQLAGGIQTATGIFTHTDGTTGAAANLNLASNTFYREYSDTITLPDDVKALPDARGSGDVRDLREAAAQSADVKALLAQYAAATTRAEQQALLEPLLLAWSVANGGPANVLDKARAHNIRLYLDFEGVLRHEGLGGFDYTRPTKGAWRWEEDDNPSAIVRPADEYAEQLRGYDGSQPFTEEYISWINRVSILEHFTGQDFFGYGGSTANSEVIDFGSAPDDGFDTGEWMVAYVRQEHVQELGQSYLALKQSVYASLILQTRLKPYLNEIDVQWNEVTGFAADFSGMVQLLSEHRATDAREAFLDLAELQKYAGGQLHDMGWDGMLFNTWMEELSGEFDIQAALKEIWVDVVPGFEGTADHDFVFGNEGENSLKGGAGGDDIFGGNGIDVLEGQQGNDLLVGGADGDSLYGGSGNDTLDGSKDNAVDNLYGDEGVDTYIYRRGYGRDMIYGQRSEDVLKLADTTASNLKLERIGNSLEVVLMDANGAEAGRAVVSGFFNADDTGIKQIELADGTVLTEADIRRLTITYGSTGDDTITGYNGAPNTVYGRSGWDTITGGDQADKLYGETGRDNLYGGAGNDQLDGGLDNEIDYLYGEAGADTYIYQQGYGHDYIYGQRAEDALKLADGTTANVSLERIGNDLEVLLKDANDVETGRTTVSGQFASNGGGVARIELADGTILSESDIQQRASAVAYGTSNDDNITGANGTPNTIYGRAGWDNITGGDQADKLYGESGRDNLYGGAGSDLLDGGLDNEIDYLNGEAGADTYVYKQGYGRDYIYGQRSEDVLKLADSNVANTLLERNGGDLVVVLKDANGIETGRATVSGQFTTNGGGVSRIEFADGTVWNAADISAQAAFVGTNGDDNMTGANGTSNIIYGRAGWDNIAGGDQADKLYGEAGRDNLYGGAGNDVLDGGLDNEIDYLNGEAGADTYVYQQGYGRDYIYGQRSEDVLKLADSAAANTVLERIGNDLHVVLKDANGVETGRATVSSQFATNGGGVSRIEFADGIVWTTSDISAQAGIVGTNSDDSMYGADGVSNRLYGRGGNDMIYGGDQADRLYGEAGTDWLNGGAGSDVLDGGAGGDTDYLSGQAGNDNYLFARGYGTDRLADNDATAGNHDVLTLAADISHEQLWLRQAGNNLEVCVIGTADKAVIADWYSSTSNHVEEIRAGNGMVLMEAQVQNLVQAMAGLTPPPMGQLTLTQEQLDQLAPTLAANWQVG